MTAREGVTESELRSSGRTRRTARGRRIFSQIAVKKLGDSGAEVARFLGVTTSAVNRSAGLEAVSDLEGYT
jgi:hypothetical protein